MPSLKLTVQNKIDITNLEDCSSTFSSIPSEVPDRGVELLSLSRTIVLHVLTPKLAPKLPKLNFVLSDSGTWMWFGKITCWRCWRCKSSSFLCSFEVASSESRTFETGCDLAVASTVAFGASDAPAVPEPWTAFGFHSLLDATVKEKFWPKNRTSRRILSVKIYMSNLNKIF